MERTPDTILTERLRSAREQAGLTQEEVAERVGLGRQALSEIERGLRRVTATELFAFARLYGKSFEWFLAAREEAEVEEEESVFLRATAVSEGSREILRDFFRRCLEYAELESLIGDEVPPPFDRAQRTIRLFEDCWILADEERRRLGLGEAPGNEFQEVLEERLRVKVLFADLPPEMSAASVLSNRFGPAILLNRADLEGRRIWSLAHEYFHLLTFGRVEGDGGPRPIRACAAPTEGEKKPREERFADQFAAAFLLAEEAVRARVRAAVRDEKVVRWEDLSRVAMFFGVSTLALLWRLANLKVLSRDVAEKYRGNPEGPAALDRVIREAHARPEPRSRRLEAIAVQLYLREHISGGRLAEILGCDRADVETIVRAYRPPSKDVSEFRYHAS